MATVELTVVITVAGTQRAGAEIEADRIARDLFKRSAQYSGVVGCVSTIKEKA
jgi:hypothetical protein